MIAVPAKLRFVAFTPRTVPVVVPVAVRFTSVPVNAPLEVMFTAFPVNAELPVSTLNALPEPRLLPVDTFSAVPVVRVFPVATFTAVPVLAPAPAVSVLPLATVVLPLRFTFPVLVSKVPVEPEKLKLFAPDAAVIAPWFVRV